MAVRIGMAGMMTTLLLAAPGYAQAPSRASSSGGLRTGMVAPGYGTSSGNPYLNPMLNPALLPARTDPAVPLLYFLSANEATGGLGSGRLSGVRPGPAREIGGPVGEDPRSTMTPGAGASRFFHRGPSQSTGRPTGYLRQNRYFAQNRR